MLEEEEQESIFASVTDLMVGVLFVFLLLLTYFALDFKAASDAVAKTQERRADLVQALSQRLIAQNIPVTVDARGGVIRLPDRLLFPKGEAELTPAGRAALARLGAGLADLLRDYPDQIETVLIEGHTDGDPLSRATRHRDNYELSAARAIATRAGLMGAHPQLAAQARALIGVAGYGPDRPLASEASEAGKSQNRRIELRLIVATPGL
jgi:flagellar motor protein MotB